MKFDLTTMTLAPHCPSYALDCPYCGKNGVCKMYFEEGVLPYNECEEWEGLEIEE